MKYLIMAVIVGLCASVAPITQSHAGSMSLNQIHTDKAVVTNYQTRPDRAWFVEMVR